MKKLLLGPLAAALVIAGGIAATSHDALAGGGVKYRVTVTNPNRGQPLAPGLFITHSKRFSLFETNGQPASAGLATMAETGDPTDLKAEVDVAHGVKSTDVLPGREELPPIFLPGVSKSFTIHTSRKAEYFTIVAMLGSTNDAFYALRGIELPREGKVTLFAPAYDAGSEMNTEKSEDIPGPTNKHVDPGEGLIHIHTGIRGAGDLDPAVYDWRNPVAVVTVERIYGHGHGDY